MRGYVKRESKHGWRDHVQGVVVHGGAGAGIPKTVGVRRRIQRPRIPRIEGGGLGRWKPDGCNTGEKKRKKAESAERGGGARGRYRPPRQMGRGGRKQKDVIAPRVGPKTKPDGCNTGEKKRKKAESAERGGGARGRYRPPRQMGRGGRKQKDVIAPRVGPKTSFCRMPYLTPCRTTKRADLEDLPFVQALIKEILRLRSPLTMGFPHSMAEDVFYKGHVLPKGSTVMLNNYAISTDPEVFDDPAAFKPERFLMTEFGTIPGRDKNFRDSFIFGRGRRICPGQFVAQYTVELITMRLIWALHFKDAIDAKTKKRIAPGLSADHYDFELVVSPRPFECSITPRPERAQMLKENFFAATGELQKYEIDLEESDKQRLRELRARLS
ncbi:cytochrome P450 [Hymenopellis radicata]|nr:cytochrome P450 [Hymenopellis radicata]